MTHIIKPIRNLAFVALMTILAASCKKSFLEIQPKGRLVAQQASDYQQLLNNLTLLNIGADAQIPMGDEVAALESYLTAAPLRTQRLFRWEDKIYEDNENA